MSRLPLRSVVVAVISFTVLATGFFVADNSLGLWHPLAPSLPGISIATPIPTPTRAKAPSRSIVSHSIAEPKNPVPRQLYPPLGGYQYAPGETFGCPSTQCATNLAYAVNGCTCAGQVYTESTVSATYCCNAGFSDSECPEALAEEAALEATFGASQDEVEAQLVNVQLQGWTIQVHRLAAPAFEQVNRNLANVNDYSILEQPEPYSWTIVEGHSVLSPHAFGIAVDIDPSANPRCGVTAWCPCYNDMVTDMPSDFIQAFKDAGFVWGGDWSEQPDPMHFEWDGWR